MAAPDVPANLSAVLPLSREAICFGGADAAIAPLSDAQLIDAVATVLSVAKVDWVDSFVLHSGLELMARAALLGIVAPTDRVAVRRQILALAADFHRAGVAIDPPPPLHHATAEEALTGLRKAVEVGDVDGVDAPAAWLAANVDPGEVAAAVAPLVLDRLAAAAHGSIWSYLLPRVAARQPAVTGTLRPLARELARNPGWRLTWFRDERGPAPGSGPASWFDALAAADLADRPSSTFIYPTMDAVERAGLAAQLLSRPLAQGDLARAKVELPRIAAMSMLQDDPAHAPYGWSHCLTMTQAVLGVAQHTDPHDAVAVAATFVLGFRATLSAAALDPSWAPAPPARPGLAGLEGSRADAVAAVWHATDTDLAAAVPRLAAMAGGHRDAHLAKYVLACFDAAAADPGGRRLFLAAAAHLAAWWREHDAAG
jgi:hypothetical protein